MTEQGRGVLLQHHGEIITRILRVFLEMLIGISRFRLENLKKKIFCFFCPDVAVIGAKYIPLIVQVKVGGEGCTKGNSFLRVASARGTYQN